LDDESRSVGDARFEVDAVLIRDNDLPDDDPWIAPTSKRFGKVLADDDDEGFLEDHETDEDDAEDDDAEDDGPFLAFEDDGEDEDEEDDAFAFDDDAPSTPKRTPEAQRMHKRLGKQPKGRRSVQGSGPEVMGSRVQRSKPQRSENVPRARRPSSRRSASAEDAEVMAPRPERRGKFARSGSPSRSPAGKKSTKGTPTGPGRRGASRSSLGKSGPGKRGPGKPKAGRSGPGRPSSGRPSTGKPSANKKRRGR
jgi:23S rRNA pseudouridine2605 synthase